MNKLDGGGILERVRFCFENLVTDLNDMQLKFEEWHESTDLYQNLEAIRGEMEKVISIDYLEQERRYYRCFLYQELEEFEYQNRNVLTGFGLKVVRPDKALIRDNFFNVGLVCDDALMFLSFLTQLSKIQNSDNDPKMEVFLDSLFAGVEFQLQNLISENGTLLPEERAELERQMIATIVMVSSFVLSDQGRKSGADRFLAANSSLRYLFETIRTFLNPNSNDFQEYQDKIIELGDFQNCFLKVLIMEFLSAESCFKRSIKISEIDINSDLLKEYTLDQIEVFVGLVLELYNLWLNNFNLGREFFDLKEYLINIIALFLGRIENYIYRINSQEEGAVNHSSVLELNDASMKLYGILEQLSV